MINEYFNNFDANQNMIIYLTNLKKSKINYFLYIKNKF